MVVADLDEHVLNRAGGEVGDDAVDRVPPPGDHDPGLAGRDERGVDPALAGGCDDLQRGGHLPDRAVGADSEHHVGVHVAGGARRDREIVVGLAHVDEVDAVFIGQRDELLVPV